MSDPAELTDEEVNRMIEVYLPMIGTHIRYGTPEQLKVRRAAMRAAFSAVFALRNADFGAGFVGQQRPTEG